MHELLLCSQYYILSNQGQGHQHDRRRIIPHLVALGTTMWPSADVPDTLSARPTTPISAGAMDINATHHWGPIVRSMASTMMYHAEYEHDLMLIRSAWTIGTTGNAATNDTADR